MQVSSATQSTAALLAQAAAQARGGHAVSNGASRASSSSSARPAAQQRANHDGDGLTGAAALRDGDAAAKAAKLGTSSSLIDIMA